MRTESSIQTRDKLTLEDQTREKLTHYLKAATSGDLEAVVDDYADDALFFTPDGLLRGKGQIRSLFEQLLPDLPALEDVTLQQRVGATTGLSAEPADSGPGTRGCRAE